MKTMRPVFFSALALLCLFSVKGENVKESQPCACAAVYKPVCGTDDKEYSNEGCAKCAGAKIACESKCPCPSPIGDCACTLEYAPVCGVDGKTYSNKCNAACDKVEIECPGECPCKRQCSCDPKPVCGSDDVTYLNECFAKKAGVTVPCRHSCPCTPSVPCAAISCILPCSRPECPEFPDAQCIGSGPCGCSEVYVSDCKVVNCSPQPQPSIFPLPSVHPSLCKKEGQICMGFSSRYRQKENKCCPGLKCCKDCVKGIDNGGRDGNNALRFFVFPATKKCMRRCPRCR